jgi:hypothetical protein
MRSFITFLLIGIAKIIHAQAVTVENETAHVEYYRMPDQPLDPSFSTYSADVDVSKSDLHKINETEESLINEYINLEGYKKVSSKGDVEVTADIGNFTVWSESSKTHRSKSKDKNGKEVEKVQYSMEVKYSLPITLEVYDKKGFLLANTSVSSSSSTYTWSSSYYNSLSDLNNYWRYEENSRMMQLHRDLLSKEMKTFSDDLNNRFGYRKIKDTTKFETIGKKKHAEYEEFQKNVDILKEAFNMMKADKGLEEIKAKIKPALAFYNAKAAEYKSNSKDDKKLKHICLLNQGVAYFWMEDFEKAEYFANEIQRLDKKDKDVKRLMKILEDTRASMEAANRTSRHMISVGTKT